MQLRGGNITISMELYIKAIEKAMQGVKEDYIQNNACVSQHDGIHGKKR